VYDIILTHYLYAASLLQPQKRDLQVLWDFRRFCRSFIIMWGERTHHKHWHQGHGPSGSSKDKKHDKRQPKFIPDNYSSVDEVTTALREAGLESSNLILGIDFTKSNEWSGDVTPVIPSYLLFPSTSWLNSSFT
jgi:hypothetical protein